MKMLLCCITVGVGALCQRTALAWNDYGHELSAAIAWQDLKPEVRTRITAILKTHPQYDRLSEKCPTGFDLDQFVFMKAATWPDMVRDRKNPLQQTEHKGPWHYINIPVEVGGVKGPQPALDPCKPGAEPLNIVQAIAKCEADLKDLKVADAEKAKRLCWVEHLVGDIHQPLHAVSLFSPQFPTGDQGGNLFFVSVSGSPEKLHALWDNMLGKSTDAAAIAARARKLRDNPAFSPKALASKLAQKTPAEWARDSAAVAKAEAYRDGTLKGVKGGKDPDQAGGPVPALPDDYRGKAEKVSEERIVLAGYRLAERVNAGLAKPIGVVP